MANLLEQALDKAGLSRYTAKLKHALAGKQDKITGTKGQVVGFGPDGKPAAKSMEDVGGPWLPLKGGTVTGTLNVQAPTAAANPATKKYVDDTVGKISSIPFGMIAMWSGAASAIPSGWVLCNGQNNTPDLRSRFIVGAGGRTV